MAQLLQTTRFTAPSPVQASFTVTIPATQPGSTLIVPAGGGAVITLQLGVGGPTFTKRTRSLSGMEIACHDIVDATGGTTTIAVTLNGPETIDGMIFEFAAGSVGAYVGGATEPGGASASTNVYGNAPTGPIVTTTPSLYFSMFGTTNNPSSAPQNQYWGLEPIGKQFVNTYNSATNGPSHYWSMIGLSSLANAGTYTGNTASMVSTYQAGSWAYEDLRPDLPAYANPYHNALEAENSLPGAAKAYWASGSTHPNIAGYTSAMSYSAGDTVDFKVDSQGVGFTVEVFRMGGYCYERFAARHQVTLTGTPTSQPAPTIDSYGGTVCSWATNASWTIPVDAVPGVYRFNMLRSDNAGYIASGLFVVKSPKPAGKSSQVMLATAEFTWQAYNAWGATSDYGGINTFSGRSLYTHAPNSNFSDRAFAVSFDRPLGTLSSNSSTCFWDSEMALINFLEMNGYDVAYYSSTDLDSDPTIPSHYQVAVSHGHSEYWTNNLRNAYENARDAGTHLVFISGNTALWRVRFDPADSSRRRIICYKDSADTTGWDGVTKYDPVSYTGTWRDIRTTPGGVNNTARRPESGMTGQWFIGNGTYNDTFAVSTDFAALPIWRNTALAATPVITVRGTATGALAATGTSITLNTPASMQVGDLIVFALVFNGNPGDVQYTFSGFRPLRITVDGTSQTTAIGTFYAKTPGAQPINISWGNSMLASAVMTVYGNAVLQDTASTIIADTVGGVTHTTASLSTVGSTRWAIGVFADTTTSNTTATTTWTPGTGLTLRGTASSSGNASGPWSSISLMDTNGPVTAGQHHYDATAEFANAHASAGLFYITPGVAARMMTIGGEWDYVKRDEPSTPTNLVSLSAQRLPLDGQAAAYNGDTYIQKGVYTYGLSLYRANSGALVFNAGSWRFSFGLSRYRDSDLQSSQSVDPLIQQAMINLLGDMGVQPGTLISPTQNNDPIALVGPGSAATAAAYGLTITPTTYQTIFRSEQEPTTRNAADGYQYTVSTVFMSSNSGTVYGVRWYFPETLPNEDAIGLIYTWDSDTAGTELARVTFTNTQTGWCQALFSVPVAIQANTKYVVAVWTRDAFPGTNNMFTSAVSNGSGLTAIQDTASAHNGKYSYGYSGAPSYPTNTYLATWYGVDLLFLADSTNPALLQGWGIPIN